MLWEDSLALEFFFSVAGRACSDVLFVPVGNETVVPVGNGTVHAFFLAVHACFTIVTSRTISCFVGPGAMLPP